MERSAAAPVPAPTSSHVARALLAVAVVTAASLVLLTVAHDPAAVGLTAATAPPASVWDAREAVRVPVQETVTVTVTVTVAPAADPPASAVVAGAAVTAREDLAATYADALPFGTSARRFPRCTSGCSPRFPPPPRRVADLASHLVCLGLTNRTRSCSLANVCYDASVTDPTSRLRFFTGSREPLHPAAATAVPGARARLPCLPTRATPRAGEGNVTENLWVCDGDPAWWTTVIEKRSFPAFIAQVRSCSVRGRGWPVLPRRVASLPSPQISHGEIPTDKVAAWIEDEPLIVHARTSPVRAAGCRVG